MLLSDKVFKKLYESVLLSASDFDTNKEDIDNIITNYDYSEIGHLLDVKYKNVTNFLSVKYWDSVDILYSLKNALHFVAGDKAYGKEVDLSILKQLPCEDIVVDINDKCYCKLSKARYTSSVKSDPIGSDVYKFTITVDTDGTQAELQTIEGDLLVKSYPRFFLEQSYMHLNTACKDCPCSCNTVPLTIHQKHIEDMPDGTKVEKVVDWATNFVLWGKNKRVNDNCALKREIEFYSGHSFEELLNVCLYAISVYVNRRKRTTVLTEENGLSVRRKLSEARDRSEARYITLKEFVIHERRERREALGGHHSSPVEHERQSHYRHLKNGKVVEVRATTVNKGGKKAVYKVD